MKYRLLAGILTLVMLLSLLPAAGAKPLTTDEVGTQAFGGTLNTQTDLLFDFSNKTTDQTRYKSSAYGGYNFDQESNGYWATGYNDSKSDYTISNTNGTLRVHVTNGADANGTPGPWIKVTNKYGVAPSYSESSYSYYPLNFDPSSVKAVTIKFKLSGCSAPSGEIPKIVFEYYYTKDGKYTYANDMWASFTLDNGYYQTVTIPVSSKLKNADVLKGFGFRFRNVKATNGTIYIDHIYIGADANFVLSSHSDKTFHSQSVNPILSGVNESQVYLKNTTDGTQIAGYMATVAPSAKVTFKASYPGYYTKGSTVASRQTAAPNIAFKGAKTTEQAAAYETATGETVYLAINADFFNMDTFQPRGQLVLEGNVIQTYGTRATPYFAVLKDGSYAIRPYGSPMADVQEAVAGYHWLVRDGAIVTQNDEELAPRTAIGLKADGTVVIFAADGRQAPYSVGTTIYELGELMKAAGCVNAINLDGGGSTTFATRYSNGDSDLKIRNSPSDSTGERVVTSTLLLVAESCKHNYNKNYAVNNDGTHSVTCASCAKTITVTHTYTNGDCVCGDARHLGKGLYFGFGNGANDKYRYDDPAYNYFNYDMTNNGKWFRGYWATGYTSTTADYTINNSAGTLTVNVGESYSGSAESGNLTYGPWLKITNGHGVQTSKTVSTYAPLYYDPTSIDIVQIRFKISGCEVPSGTTPKLYFEYYYEKNGTYTGATDMYTTYSFTEGEYVTVTLPASKTLSSADVLRGFGLRFQNIKSSSGGKLVIDYIFIGESADHTLIFNFDNSAEAKARYQSLGYGFTNFDTASNGYWATYYNGANTNFSVNNAAGTLTVSVTEGYSSASDGSNIIYGPWVKTTNTYGKFTGRTTYDYYPLSYDPKNAEAFQIRFKTENIQVDEGKTPRVVLEYYYTLDGVYTTTTDIVDTYTLKNGEYQIVTIPVTAKFKAADEILCFGIRFQHIKSSSNGSLVIDYIAIGKNDSLPSPRYTVTFQNHDGSTLAQQTLYKGETATYTGAMPTKAPDSNYHYSFDRWDKALSNISGNTVFTAQFQATAHSFSYSSTEDGKHVASCSCGYEVSTVHIWDTGALTTAPTCTAEGVMTYVCTDCGAKKTERIAATGHSSVTDPAVAPTCTEGGLTEGSHCAICSTVLEAQQAVPPKGHTFVYTSADASTHKLSCSACGAEQSAPHSFVDGYCVCGESEIKEPILVPGFTLSHSLNLASDISVNFVVPKTYLTGFDMDTVYVESIIEVYDGNILAGTRTIRLEPVDNGYTYYFTLAGLTAVQMNDRIRSVIYGTKDGQAYYSPVDDYSIADYAYSQLNKTNTTEVLKTLCADLLRYGSKAQIYKNYRTDALASSAMTSDHEAFLSDMESVTFGNVNEDLKDLENAPIQWAGKSLNLDSKVCLKFVFRTSAYTGKLSDLSLRISYEDRNGELKSVTLAELEVYSEAAQLYSFTVDSLLAAELRSVVSVQVYAVDTPVSSTLRYSSDTYGTGKTGTLGELCKALFAYSDSARRYFTA